MSLHQHHQRFQPPKLFSISRGEVTRIEPYGCFVKLIPSNNTSSSSSNISISGLVHISQLYTSKVANVSDIVSLNDTVWVKVIDIQVETITDDETGRTRPRHKVKLSMKYVNQENGHDLDPENELFEEDRQRSGNNSGRGGGAGGGNEDGGANSLLGRALVSNIGMSIAMDPGNLILRGTTSRGAAAAASSRFNGYALVGDDEGVSSPPPPVGDKDEPSSSLVANNSVPMGRGRGMTLPAWMTKSDSTDRLGSVEGVPSNDNNHRMNEDNTEKRHRRDKRHHHTSDTKERHSSRKVHKQSNRGDSSRKERKHRRRRRRRSRSTSSSYSSNESRRSSHSPSSSSDYRSPSRSVERHTSRPRQSHPRKKAKSHKHDKHRRSRQKEREYSRSRSRSPSRRHRSSPLEIANVEEARAIVERLERRR
ncbi:hypothetical protein ACHAWU_004141 [Discostella pseudostelligera]|uniref:S1 motif domain-containing protein n=1 Tax=Discostella pseudostelligera TaxID=259834 RepID=A0ABD3MQ48_9STRA